MQSEASVEIDCPIDEVFRAANEDVVQWSRIVVEREVLEAKPEGVGTIFRVATKQNGQRMEFMGVVTRYEPPQVSGVFLQGALFDVEGESHFENLGARTRVTQTSRVKGKGFVKVLFFLCGWLMKKAGRKAAQDELDSLKRYCERAPQQAGETDSRVW